MYFPSRAWNAYQLWADYDPAEIERDVRFASRLGLNSLRVYASYEFWKPPERGAAFLGRLDHFLGVCADYGIRPLLCLFEGTPQHAPTDQHLEDRNPATAKGVHSPAKELTRDGNWRGDRSPLRFTEAVATQFGADPRLLALSIANEPFGGGEMTPEFLAAVHERIREHAPEAVVTLGSANLPRPEGFGGIVSDLDVHQFHANVPADAADARSEFDAAARHRDRTGTPVWLTEWQRLREARSRSGSRLDLRSGLGSRFGRGGGDGRENGPESEDGDRGDGDGPHPMRPDPASMASLVAKALADRRIQGHFLWGLMLKPAYLLGARRQGRINGLFHETGAVFQREAADAIAGHDTGLPEHRAYPYRFASHPHPYDLLAVDRGD